MYALHKLTGVFAMTSKAVISLVSRTAALHWACTGPSHGCSASALGFCRDVGIADTHRCICNDKEGYYQLGFKNSSIALGMHRSHSWLLCIKNGLLKRCMHCTNSQVYLQ
ncbi:hypothetical protein ABBQ38_006543 [Trebouxia sp. C0009 RCD-2024]